MRAKGSTIRIAINTMRARLTILGFNLAIITFQITHLLRLRSGPVVPDFDAPLHLPAMVALHFALLLSVSAMVLFVASGTLSEEGACDSPAVIVGDLLMYLGLAYSVVGFFQPLVAEIAARQLPTAGETADFRILIQAISVSTAIAWALTAYVGPIVSLLRSPFSMLRNAAMGAGYLLLMVVLAYFWGVASELQSSLEGRPTTEWPGLRLIFMPIDWLATGGIKTPQSSE
jgi:hypothetical protein